MCGGAEAAVSHFQDTFDAAAATTELHDAQAPSTKLGCVINNEIPASSPAPFWTCKAGCKCTYTQSSSLGSKQQNSIGITVEAGASAKIICKGANSCYAMSVNGGEWNKPAANVEIICSGKGSCEAAGISGAMSAEFNADLQCTGSGSCRYMGCRFAAMKGKNLPPGCQQGAATATAATTLALRPHDRWRWERK